ncbi:CbtA family protein [Steroidobacter sp.]|uniref:CbtA family protein n=1 Tax=Steroidobacter sp. TaxID=1978227 RepID=UPI001A528625|nr:CbtA family protein [Steroidobacter sp.]MBL8268308.1 CbtA family protein [Steroidobacter sp.]
MLRDTLLAAALSGLFAALLLTFVQSVWVTPLIMEAETYETVSQAVAHEHEHGVDEEWSPADGWQRTSFTLAANLVMGLGYSLLLLGVYLLWRQPSGLLSGAAFGVAGFVVFFAAPSLGLPPELPGTVAAPVSERQLWWAMTAVLTGGGLLLLFAKPFSWLKAVAGVALVIAPHFVAAPEPEVHAALAPETLQHRFQIATSFANAIFWILLGAASSHAFRKLMSWHGRLDAA